MQLRFGLRALTLAAFLYVVVSSPAQVTTFCCDQAAEDAYLAAVAAMATPMETAHESFESGLWLDLIPTPASFVTDQGLTWSRFDAALRVSTGGGNVIDGSYLMYAYEPSTGGHPVPDGYTMTANGFTLNGVGGWIRGNGVKIGIVVDGDPDRVDFTGEDATVFGWKFFGFIDEAGFGGIEMVTRDEVGDETTIFVSDDFTIAAPEGSFPVADEDLDGVGDAVDNCLVVSNPAQIDADGDQIGNLCDADFNQDCIVNSVDLGVFKVAFFSADPVTDLDSDGIVNAVDLGLLKTLFFLPPGPSALPDLCD